MVVRVVEDWRCLLRFSAEVANRERQVSSADLLLESNGRRST